MEKQEKKNLKITNISKDIKNNKDEPYELMGVVAHSGTKNGGHYIAYVKRNNKIYKCDDDKINQKEKGFQDLYQTNFSPYILLYKRKIMI